MRTTKLVVLLTLAIVLAVFVLQNQESWQVHFLWLSGEVPGVILLFLTVVAGLIMGLTAALLIRRGEQPRQQRGEARD